MGFAKSDKRRSRESVRKMPLFLLLVLVALIWIVKSILYGVSLD